MLNILEGNIMGKNSMKSWMKFAQLNNSILVCIVIVTLVQPLSSTREVYGNIFIEDLQLSNATFSITFDTHDILVSPKELVNISYSVEKLYDNETISELELDFISTNTDVADNISSAIIDLMYPNYTEVNHLVLTPMENGYTVITVSVDPPNMTDIREAFLRLSVHYSTFLDYLSDIVGWLYFFAWSISFYPQTLLNWKRKSVIGLHFDFLALNTIGFLVYSIFNIGLYFVHEIEREYFKRHPYGVNPVQLNDVIFSIHALFACIIQVVQCLIYERGEQKISQTAKYLFGSISIISIIAFILGGTNAIAWIDFLYILSYIKLFITLIKYIPQAYYNYLRKSTSGWSIGNILLDFTGGTLSICQMFILAFNYNDWSSIFGDPTKFGLGLFSIMFDIYFMIQHFILYRGHENYIPFPDSPPLSHQSSSHSGNPLTYGSMNGN